MTQFLKMNELFSPPGLASHVLYPLLFRLALRALTLFSIVFVYIENVRQCQVILNSALLKKSHCMTVCIQFNVNHVTDYFVSSLLVKQSKIVLFTSDVSFPNVLSCRISRIKSLALGLFPSYGKLRPVSETRVF